MTSSQHNPETETSNRRIWRRLVWACVLMVTLVVGVVGYRFQRAVRFIDRVKAAGGNVMSDGEPGWGEKWLGDRYALALKSHDIIELAPQERLELLSQYPDQFGRVLHFSGGTIDKKQADAYAAIQLDEPEMMLLVNYCSPIHTAMYDAVSAQKSLVYVGFTGATINLKAFASMKSMSNLRSVSMEFCTLISEEQVFLSTSDFPVLESLSFRSSNLDDHTFEVFEELINQCRELELGETAITDQSVLKINPTSKVRAIVLVDTKLTDQSLEHLAKLKNLEVLYVYETQMTERGVKEFRKKNPRCVVEF